MLATTTVAWLLLFCFYYFLTQKDVKTKDTISHKYEAPEYIKKYLKENKGAQNLQMDKQEEAYYEELKYGLEPRARERENGSD
jgi:hypothetical protein